MMKLGRTRHFLAISISIGCFGYFLSAYGDERQNIVWIDQAGAEAFFDLEGYWLTCIVYRTVYSLTWRLSGKGTDTLIPNFPSNIWSCSGIMKIRPEQQVKDYGEMQLVLLNHKLMRGQATPDRLKQLFM